VTLKLLLWGSAEFLSYHKLSLTADQACCHTYHKFQYLTLETVFKFVDSCSSSSGQLVYMLPKLWSVL